ncbi:DUF881 domain-containing protein [Bacillus vallismortis]|uniref:DUF881 domain-containing protein n=1 Tax=Bacillus vallismortis TaxID=72361 RepID=A0AAP3CF73_BACVA|nr:DUF881 domain-containing protein [Bacillus vallismortis]MCY7918234.1 DUF881 domain-containing protein [Bacillus vallismortis]MCY8315393.1 DUF881 domain-containing protein [Bacillus vallismortis]MCY8423781.1 DUF881 domain-containing protein [Bacillus vallismortis]MCY8533072.1 DUF881 domain-containing protein [Bacillus vallismortis]MCY8546548.1 DUF881 domain-containing protein [Bacillus vallismortis]
MRGKSAVLLSLIMLIAGFLISFSFQTTKENETGTARPEEWKKEYALRDELLKQEKENKNLEKELYQKQNKVREEEKKLKKEKTEYYNVLEDTEKYRMYIGEVGVQGEGVQVTLEDASYIPEGENVNSYIVHESHIFQVVNELYISGAAAVAVNGQRLTHDSYIKCNGPVVTVDGVQHPAPFTISAIGDPDVLLPSLNIAGGLINQLSMDHISVSAEKKKNVQMKPILKTKE